MLRVLGVVLVAAWVYTAEAGATELVGRATVIDGDTIEIHGQRVRLFGIDAPESDQVCRDGAGKAYGCGRAAANALDTTIGGKIIVCEARDTDRFGRTVARCTAGGTDVAEELVRAGLALDYAQYSRGAYRRAQAAADRQGAGLWRGPFVEPWLYRACRQAGGRLAECSSGSKPK